MTAFMVSSCAEYATGAVRTLCSAGGAERGGVTAAVDDWETLPALVPLFTAPTLGRATYGNDVPKARSFALTASPAASALTSLPVCAAPSSACSSMSTTSSVSRRPFGKPCRSPASTPSRFGFAVGFTDRFSRSISDGRKALGLTSALLSWELRSALIGPPALVVMPVRKISTRSLRGVAGALTP